MAETVPTRHRLTGRIDLNTPVHIAKHPVLGAQLDIVGPDAKPIPAVLVKVPKADVEVPKTDDAAKPKNSKD